MTDQPAAPQDQSTVGVNTSASDANASYVDSYQPPVVSQQTQQPPQQQPWMATPVAASFAAPDTNVPDPTMPVSTPAPVAAMPAYEPPPVVSMPTAPEPPAPVSASQPGPAVVSQTLEDQNIFNLLGVTDGTDEEREAFLDELQQVIWEDFVENDVSLLITEEEMVGFRAIMEKGDSPEVQEEMIVYLEKLVPDLEEIMLEKALELKEDMVRERIAGMKEYYAARPTDLEKIATAEQHLAQDQWRSAAEVLNAISR
jgi:hypothetical protein